MKKHRGRRKSLRFTLGLTMRSGLVFCGLLCFLAVLATLQPRVTSERQHVAWIVALVSVGLAGFIHLRQCQVPARIEQELQRVGGETNEWKSVRPMLGSGDVVDAWNTLLEQLEQRHDGPVELGDSQPANDQMALMARAMRSINAGIAVTDSAFRIKAANRPISCLFRADASQSVLQGNLLDLLQTLCNPEHLQTAELGNSDDLHDENQRALEQLSTGGNTVQVRLHIACPQVAPASNAGCPETSSGERGAEDEQTSSADSAQEARVLRLHRTRLSGRESDSTGFAWLIQDVTQQVLATKARDEFLHTATHELRTPLANLRAYAEALSIEDGVSLQEQKEFCNVITHEANRLSRLVDHLLTVGQMEAGALTIHVGRLETGRIISEVLENLRPQILQSGLELETAISPKLRNIRGDKEKLQATLVNLIGNAIKYTPSGGRIRVAANVMDDWLEVSVEDSGMGISAEDQEKIFDKFYRVNNEAVSEQAGNGLGLTFARNVARLHRGDVLLESELGSGSKFTLRLPAPDIPEES